MRSVALLLLLAGCYAPKPPQGAPCGPGDACPSGLTCRDGVCVSSGGSLLDADPNAEDADIDAPSADAALDAAADAASACPASYMAITGQTSKYRTELTQRDWLAAEQDCEDDGVGTHLAVIDSAAEDAAVDALTGASIWFGLSDRADEATELWVTGAAPLYMNTVGVDDTGPYDCAGIYQSEWAWGECDTQIEYVCECDGVAADPTAY